MAYGLLQGLGQGMAQMGGTMVKSHLDEMKEQRLQQYRLEAEQRQNERQDAIREEDRDREDSMRSVREEVTRENGKQITTQYNKDGEVIGTKESILDPKDPQRRFYMSGNTLYDAYNTDKDGNPITVQVGGGAGVTSQQINAAKAIVSSLKDKVMTGGLTPEEQSEYDQARRVISLAAGIQSEGVLGTSGRSIDQSREWAEKRVGRGGLLRRDNYGELGDRNTALDYYTEYDQAVHRGEQGLSPSAWMARRRGQAPSGQGGANNDPSAALDALRSGGQASAGSASPKGRDAEAQKGLISRMPTRPAPGRAALATAGREIKDAYARAPQAQAESMLRNIEGRLELGHDVSDGTYLQQLDSIYRNQNLPEDMRRKAEELFAAITRDKGAL